MTNSFGRFFLPGPTEVHPEVLAAMVRPMIPHRGREMQDLLGGLVPSLKRLFRTERNVHIGTTSATGFMEMAVRNGVHTRCLSLVSGAFGERFAHIADACGKEVVRLDVQAGTTFEPEYLRDALRRTPVDAVTMVHSETSTGVLAPVAEFAEVVRPAGRSSGSERKKCCHSCVVHLAPRRSPAAVSPDRKARATVSIRAKASLSGVGAFSGTPGS